MGLNILINQRFSPCAFAVFGIILALIHDFKLSCGSNFIICLHVKYIVSDLCKPEMSDHLLNKIWK